MTFKVKLRFRNAEDDGEVRILSNGKIQANNIELSGLREGPLLIDIMRRIASWMTKNEVLVMEIEDEE